MSSKMISLIILILLMPALLIISILIWIIDGGPIIFKQKRIGINNSDFTIYKFRTMKNGIDDVPTHLLKDPKNLYIKFGYFMRKYSLDELPQLLNIIKGDIVFVGPRPALYNQYDLIDLRSKSNIHLLMPGITGWSQINGRDNLTVEQKVELDRYYLKNKSFSLNFIIIIKTFIQLIKPKGIAH